MSEYSITKYPDAEEINKKLDELIKKPIYSIKEDKLKEYEEEYFEKK